MTIYRLISKGTIEQHKINRQVYKSHLSDIAIKGSTEDRIFEGVSGIRAERGELFGLQNLLRYDENDLPPAVAARLNNVDAGFGIVEVEDNTEDDRSSGNELGFDSLDFQGYVSTDDEDGLNYEMIRVAKSQTREKKQKKKPSSVMPVVANVKGTAKDSLSKIKPKRESIVELPTLVSPKGISIRDGVVKKRNASAVQHSIDFSADRTDPDSFEGRKQSKTSKAVEAETETGPVAQRSRGTKPAAQSPSLVKPKVSKDFREELAILRDNSEYVAAEVSTHAEVEVRASQRFDGNVSEEEVFMQPKMATTSVPVRVSLVKQRQRKRMRKMK